MENRFVDTSRVTVDTSWPTQYAIAHVSLSHSQKRLAALLILLALLSGCAPAPEKPQVRDTSTERAAQLADAGRYDEAATLYLGAAADAPPERRDGLLLQAAEWFMAAGERSQARGVMDRVRRDRLSREQALRHDLLAAELALARDAAAEALALLPFEAVEVPPDLRMRYHRLRARALLEDDRPFESARERLELAQWLSEAELVHSNREALFSALLRLSPGEMQARIKQLAPDDPMQGWLALAFDMKTRLFEGEPMEDALDRWRQQYPRHPAGENLADDLVDRYRSSFNYPESVALLLPLSGRYESAAESIRNGFFTAFYDDSGRRPALRVYDVEAHPQGVVGAYRQAVDDGAGWVVGPLDRTHVERLMSQPALPVPVLALNYAQGRPAVDESALMNLRPENSPAPGEAGDDAPAPQTQPGAPAADSPARVYQFGLLPEQEAHQAARRLMQEGRRRALVLAPRDDWGNRLMQAFVDEYMALGGYVADVALYSPDEADHSGVLRRLLALDDSVRRASSLERVLGRSVESVPQARDDADALFLAARPRQARLIRPQLRFFEAVNLPVYGTSHLYGGRPSPGNDSDLDGVVFCDAPWMIGTADRGPARDRLRDLFPDVMSQSGRLFALGADAYRLIPYLDWLTDHPGDEFRGLSGALSVDRDLRLHRELAWARFRDGAPVPLSGNGGDRRP